MKKEHIWLRGGFFKSIKCFLLHTHCQQSTKAHITLFETRQVFCSSMAGVGQSPCLSPTFSTLVLCFQSLAYAWISILICFLQGESVMNDINPSRLQHNLIARLPQALLPRSQSPRSAAHSLTFVSLDVVKDAMACRVAFWMTKFSIARYSSSRNLPKS